MTITTVLAIVLGVYLLGLVGLSIYATGHVRNEEDYVVAGRRLPLFLSWGTLLATWFGAATVLGAAQAARDEGLAGTVLEPFAAAASLIVAGLFFARPMWNMKLLTLGDFYAQKYGPRSEILSSLILVPGYFGWIGSQLIALAVIQQTFFGIDPRAGILLGALVVFFYTMIGGMWSVTLTDTAQMVVILVCLTLLGWSVFGQFGEGNPAEGVRRLWHQTPPEMLTFFPNARLAIVLGALATFLSGTLGYIPGQDLMQRIFASRDSRTAVWACLLSGVIYVAFGLLPVGMGLLSRILMPEETEGQGHVLTILAQRFLSPAMVVIFVLAVVSAVVSTATSAVLAPATILGHNLLGRLRFFAGRGLFRERLSVVLVTAGGIFAAFSDDRILKLLEITAATLFVGLFVPLVMGIHGRPRGEWPGLLSMALGVALWLSREIMEGLAWPMPSVLAEQGTLYSDWIAGELARAGLHPWAATVVHAFAAVPSAITGATASLAGYFLGQWLSRPARRNL